MESDLALILGLVLGSFSLVGAMGAISDGRGPRASALSLLIAGGLVTFAMMTKPGGYRLEDIPAVFFGIVGQVLH